jgi:hypothetical protein
MKNKFKKTIFNIVKQIVLGLVVFAMIFPYSTLVALADPVPVKEVGWNREWNFRTSEYTNSAVELLGEIMAPIYQLATPGSFLTKDIYRYMMKQTEDELGIDKDFFRRMNRKPDAPTVDIVFAPTNPKVGEKVTAFAIPRGFKNSNEKLYYTWYLVHNTDGVGTPDVEGGRDEAMSIGARGGYDQALFLGENPGQRVPINSDGNRDMYDASYGGDDGRGKKEGTGTKCNDVAGCACVKEMTMFGKEKQEGCFDDQGQLLYSSLSAYKEAIEDRGLRSDTGKKKVPRTNRITINSEFITRCYRHNFGGQNDESGVDKRSGRDMIIKCRHAFGDEIGEGNLTFHAGKIEEKWGLNLESPDTDGDGIMDEADLAGLAQEQFTWIYRKGDKVSVAVEGMSNILINEGTSDRLRYKNKRWKGNEDHLDLSPVPVGTGDDRTASPPQWYKDRRADCQEARETSSNNVYMDCMKDLWEHELKKENDENAFGDMTGYYKIMWAAPGICTEKKEEIADNDWCDTDGDIGFQYLKLYDPVEKGKQLMEVSVNVSPKNPQFSAPETMIDDSNNREYSIDFSEKHSDSTDMIIASASVVSQDYVNPDYLYYRWSVWRCLPENFDKCEDVTEEVDFKSKKEGLGLRDIGFYPMDGMFPVGKRALIKIGVVVKKHKNSVMSSPGINGEYNDQIFSNEKKDIGDEEDYTQKYAYTASELIEVARHSMKIRLYEATPTSEGGWEEGKEICTGTGEEPSLYKKVCPVYPYQVLMARVEEVGRAIAWKLDGQNLGPTLNSENNQGVDSDTVFFPVTGTDGSLSIITVVSEGVREVGLWEDVNISEERILSVHRPMAKILDKGGVLDAHSIQRAYSGTYNTGEEGISYKRRNGKELWWVLAREQIVGSNSRVVDIPITVIPRYLENEIDGRELMLQSYSDGKNMGNVFPDNPTVFEITPFKSKIEAISNLRVRTIRQFSEDYKKALKQSFGISPLDELVDDLEVEVKAVTSDKYEVITGERVILSAKQKTGKFFASTIKNVPEYFVFILRLAVSFVLIAMMAFGLVYGVRRAQPFNF